MNQSQEQYRVIVSPQAREELNEIVSFIAQQSISGASSLLSAFDNKLQSLSFMPLSHPVAPEDEYCDSEIRHCLFKTARGGTYRSLFQIIGNEVQILHVRGPGQDIIPADDF